MTLYSGIDLHANNSVLAVLDEQDRGAVREAAADSLDHIVENLQPYKKELWACVVESTYNWYRLVDVPMDADFAVRLAHTSTVPQYAGLKKV